MRSPQPMAPFWPPLFTVESPTRNRVGSDGSRGASSRTLARIDDRAHVLAGFSQASMRLSPSAFRPATTNCAH
jgi:hypothetical protein